MKRKTIWHIVLVGLFSGVALGPTRGQAQEPSDQARLGIALESDLHDRSPAIRQRAVQALASYGRAAAPALGAALKDVSVPVRVAAAWTLGELGPAAEDAVPALAMALGDLDVQVRQTAAWALSRLGPAAEASVPELIRALKDSNVVVQANAARALGEIGPGAKEAAVALAQTTYGGHSYLGGNAANALRAIGPAAIEELRIQAARDPELQPFLEQAINLIGSE